MSGPMTCADIDGLAAELALGLVSGRERADALTHLAGCSACRAEVEGLAVVADSLSLAARLHEPPPGFENRVLIAVDSQDQPRSSTGRRHQAGTRRWSRLLLAAAAVILLVMAAGAIALVGRPGGIAGHGRSRPVAAAVLHQAVVVTPSGRVVGRLVLSHQPDAMVLSLPRWAPPDGRIGDVHAKLTLASGASVDLGAVPASVTADGWARTMTVDTRTVTRVAMVDSNGNIYCSATV